MPRPRPLPRWALLLLLCAAVAAVAMIPRGIVRTTEARQLREATPLSAEHLRIDSPTTHGSELPGVRAVVSREERDGGATTASATFEGVPDVHDSGGGDAELAHRTDGPGPGAGHTAAGSRAPPTAI